MPEQPPARPLPFFYVGKQEASQRIQKFLDDKHPLLTDAIGKTDTKSVWYSFQHIEELYKELVYLNADGLRLYYGAYDSQHEYSNQLCILMVPTFLNSSMKHEDLILENSDDFIERLGGEENIGNTEEITELIAKYKEFNYGSPCPPVCPGNEFGYP
jgi:hypothetical protein